MFSGPTWTLHVNVAQDLLSAPHGLGPAPLLSLHGLLYTVTELSGDSEEMKACPLSCCPVQPVSALEGDVISVGAMHFSLWGGPGGFSEQSPAAGAHLHVSSCRSRPSAAQTCSQTTQLPLHPSSLPASVQSSGEQLGDV